MLRLRGFPRMMALVMLKNGVRPPPPLSERVTAAQFNALTDEVNSLGKILFQQGYVLFTSSVPTRGRSGRSSTDVYATVDDYNNLKARVKEIENYLSVGDYSIMMTKDTSAAAWDDFPHIKDKYATKEEYTQLEHLVDVIEVTLSSSAQELFLVRN